MNKAISDTVLVSVVIPAYNTVSYIKQAIDSVFVQDVSLEVIVIDDASTDNLEIALEQYMERDCFVFIKNKTNIGVAESRNIGIRAAKGKYIAFLDADDWWKPNKLKKQLSCIKNKHCVLCYTARMLVSENGIEIGKNIAVKGKVDYNQLLHHNSIVCSSVLVKRTVMLDCLMDHSEYHEDYLAWLRILKKYGLAYGINEPLLFYRLSKNGKSRNKWKSVRMTYGVYRVMGIGQVRSLWFLLCHLAHGVVKYNT